MAPDQTVPVPAGWYPDPYSVSEMRWWDGQSWTDSIHPPAAQAVSQPAVAVETNFRESGFASDMSGADGDSPEPTNLTPPDIDVPATVVPAAVVPAAVVPAAVALGEQPVQPSAALPGSHRIPPLVEPGQPEPVAPPLTSLPTSPADTEPDSSLPAAATSEQLAQTPAHLPSRRELRLRDKFAQAEAAVTETAVAETAVAESAVTMAQSGTESALGVDVSAASVAIPPAATSSSPTAVSSAVPDSAVPTAFDWLPGANAGGLNAPPAPPASPSTPSSRDSRAATFTPPVVSTPASADSTVFGQNASRDTVPAVSSGPWSQSPNQGDPAARNPGRQTATRTATTSGWFIAVMPLLAGILSVSAVKGHENYPRYLPAGIEWWMLVAAVIALLYVVTVFLAIADRRKLDWAGYNQPAHWAWSLLTAPVYLLVRTISVKRETSRNSALLWVWLILVIALVGAWFAAEAFAPELVKGYVLPFL